MSRSKRWWNAIRSRPRLSLSLVLTALVYLSTSSLVAEPLTRGLAAWNVGVVVYLVLILNAMFRASPEALRTRAVEQDTGRIAMLAMAVAAVVICLTGIVFELSAAKSLYGHLKAEHIGLAIATVLSAWAFMQVSFALHYAHEYHKAVLSGRHGGLDFPGDETPDYGDFLYFSCVIGTSGQTADVSFTSRALRRTGTVHCVLAFLFNTTLVALTINIASGLI